MDVSTNPRRTRAGSVDAGRRVHLVGLRCTAPRVASTSVSTPSAAATTDATRIPTLASSLSVSEPGNDSPAMNSDTVKPTPATAPTPASIGQVVRSGSLPSPSRTAMNDASTIPTGLPSTSPATIPSATGERDRIPDATQRDAGVGQCEDRQHDVRRQRVQQGLQPLDHRHRLPEQEPEPGQLVGVQEVVLQRLAGVAPGDVLVEQRLRRRDQPDRDAGQRGVHARLEQREPRRDAEHDVDRHRPHARLLQHEHQRQQREREREPPHRQRRGVEHRDHDDRADVVHDRERQQEEPQRRRDPPTEQAEHARRRRRCRSPSGCPSRRRPRHRPRSAAYRPAGTSMPPNAATIGSAAVFGSRRSPLTSSYLISSPTTKKKITISASFTQCCSDSSSRKLPRSMPIGVCQNVS